MSRPLVKTHLVLLVLLALSLLLPLRSGYGFTAGTPTFRCDHVAVRYAQSADFWKTVGDVQNARGSLSAVNGVLQNRYGDLEETFLAADAVCSLGQSWEFGVSADGLGYGSARNPVIPELDAVMTIGGFASATYLWAPAEGWKLRPGILIGGGGERKIHAVSTDLIESLPLRSGAFALLGAEFSVEYGRSLLPVLEWKQTLFARYAGVDSTTPPADLDQNKDRVHAIFRWRIEEEFIPSPWEDWVSWHVIAGPQPLPLPVLPPIWDVVHDIQDFPELGVMLGGGIRLLKAVTVGFYGGYFGAGIDYMTGPLSLSAGTWGLEGSSAYQTQGSRLWTAQVGWHW